MTKENQDQNPPEIYHKHRDFVEAYIANYRNGTRAYKQIYGEDRSDQTAAVNASKLLRNAKVKAYLEWRLRDLSATADEVIFTLTRHMQANIDDIVTPMGEISITRARDRGAMDIIKEFKKTRRTFRMKDGSEEVTEEETVKLHDAQSAAVHLGRYHKLFHRS